MRRPYFISDWNPFTGNWTYSSRPQRSPSKPRRKRPLCAARCRDGHACRARAVWDDDRDRPRNGRCRVHGGLSTGPKTAEGKARIAAANRRRAAR